MRNEQIPFEGWPLSPQMRKCLGLLQVIEWNGHSAPCWGCGLNGHSGPRWGSGLFPSERKMAHSTTCPAVENILRNFIRNDGTTTEWRRHNGWRKITAFCKGRLWFGGLFGHKMAFMEATCWGNVLIIYCESNYHTNISWDMVLLEIFRFYSITEEFPFLISFKLQI